MLWPWSTPARLAAPVTETRLGHRTSAHHTKGGRRLTSYQANGYRKPGNELKRLRKLTGANRM